jgi:Mg2+/Co2+ transporter CorB
MELAILACLILLNGLFAMSEVALLTARRPRLATLAENGDRLAGSALALAHQPTRFLSTIQIGITSISILNGIIGDAIFSAPLAGWLKAQGLDPYWSGITARFIVVAVITYFTIVFGELVPKRLGQINAEGIARLAAWPMRGLAWISAAFVHLLSASTDAVLGAVLRLLRIRPPEDGAQPLSAEEIRTVVLESSHVLPTKHRSILLNLFDIGEITVQDVMVPRAKIEAIRLDEDMDAIARQLTTSHHRELPVYRGSGDEIAGVLNLRKVLGLVFSGALDRKAVEDLLDPPYFVPAGTPAIAQLQYFQEKRERIGLVVDEYGELMGLVTLEGIMEQIIGKFTTSLPTSRRALSWDEHGAASADGAMPVREVNRALGLDLPTDGPKTLNGLILEHLQDIPEANVSLKIAGVPMEILSTQGRAVKSLRLFRPREEPGQPEAS